MTQTLTRAGTPLFFPPSLDTDPEGVINAPSGDELEEIAEAVAPGELLLFTRRLVHSAKARRRELRWRAVNRRRLELAKLCIDRILREGLAEPGT